MTDTQPAAGNGSTKVIFIVLVALAAIWYFRGRTPEQLVPWRDDLSAALGEARTTNRPVLLYFTAEWCGPCQAMKRNVWSDKAVAEATQAFLPVRIDIDQNPQLAQQYRVEAVPLLLVLSPDGRIMRQVNHGMSAEEAAAWLKAST